MLSHNDLEQFLFQKAPPVLGENEVRELERIASLDVSDFKEADVREEIINPILKIIGHQKGQEYSVEREKHIRFVGRKDKYIDYNLTIWEQNFWLIEAKRPDQNQKSFAYKEAQQAMEYAAHPEIRAALVVLCDGIKLEIFDRDENVEAPILSILIKEITQEYNAIAKYLDPLNVWFFYRRRLLKELTRAFEKEGNFTRVEEFKKSMDRHLDKMRGQILDNYRASIKKDNNKYPDILRSATIEDIVEAHFFVEHSVPAMEIMSNILLEECKKTSAFKIIYRIFPDDPRDANDAYFVNALHFLIRLDASELQLDWAPDWLGGQNCRSDKSNLLKKIIPLLLDHFSTDEPRKIISLTAAAYRRLAKILCISNPDMWKVAELKHVATRFFYSEFSWEQHVSSAERNLIGQWNNIALMETAEFVRRHKPSNGKFNTNKAKAEFLKILETEKALLSKFPNYGQLRSEANTGELYPTDISCVLYDNLGHGALCVLKDNGKWREYVLSKHKNLILELAALGSWSAQEILGKNIYFGNKHEIASERFFYGDEALYITMTKAYAP
ncbi:MAG: hypothetical protein DI626_08980 [Micavibrio aeruginosavorus]|uniref:Type I restriction enzyme R protein N-terminal domain-containing protein n=1 Tax=Micavibrio aeruginosavorus TaxID=349221 RepID=A0A2W5BKE7_9BACT|nr:MAG: hypothetical protein DI626_08980 [Micavibrio aeruginosavorus]